MFRFLKNIFGKRKDTIDQYGNKEADKLPDKLSDGFSVELKRGGGMKMGGIHIYLGVYSCSYRKYNGSEQEQSGCSFTISSAEMEDVFSKLKLYGFDKLEMEETLKLDYPSTTLSVRWNEFHITKMISQTYTISDHSPGDFYACVGLIESIAKDKSEKHKYPVNIIVDENLQKQDSGFAIYFEEDSLSGIQPWYDSSSGKPLEILKLMPGTYLFKLYIHHPESTFMNKKYKFSEYVSLTVMEKQSSTLHITANDVMFSWKVIMQRT